MKLELKTYARDGDGVVRLTIATHEGTSPVRLLAEVADEVRDEGRFTFERAECLRDGRVQWVLAQSATDPRSLAHR